MTRDSKGQLVCMWFLSKKIIRDSHNTSQHYLSWTALQNRGVQNRVVYLCFQLPAGWWNKHCPGGGWVGKAVPGSCRCWGVLCWGQRVGRVLDTAGSRLEGSEISCQRKPLPLEQVLPGYMCLVSKVVCNTYFVFVTTLCMIFKII